MHISITGSLFPFTHTHSHTPHIHTHTLIYFICCVRRVSCYEEIYAQNEKVELLLHTSHLQSGSRGERAAEGNAAPEAICGPDAVQDLSKTNWRLPVSYLLLDWSAVTIVVTAQHQSIWQKLLDCAVLWLSIDVKTKATSDKGHQVSVWTQASDHSHPRAVPHTVQAGVKRF